MKLEIVIVPQPKVRMADQPLFLLQIQDEHGAVLYEQAATEINFTMPRTDHSIGHMKFATPTPTEAKDAE